MKIVLTREEIKKIVADRFNLSVEEFILQISAELATSPKHSSEAIITVDDNGFIQNTKKIDEPSEEEKKECIKESAEEFKKYFSKGENQNKDAGSKQAVDSPLESTDNQEEKSDDKEHKAKLATKLKKRKDGNVDRRTQPRIDYRALANEVERFLASNMNEIDLPIDPQRSASGICRRYKTATEMYNLTDKVRISEMRKANRCVLMRK